MDSPARTSNDQPILEGTPSKDSAPREEGIPVGGPSVDEIGKGSPSEVVVAPLPLLKLEDPAPSGRRLPDQVLLSTYVPPHERIHPPAGMVALDLFTAGVPLTRRTLLLCICTTSILIIFEYRWRLVRSGIPSRSLFI